jgi:HD-GYP domain-containing protein (c-di-GMP phosphodiesterase class II)
MNGLYLVHDNECTDKATKKKEELSLLAKGNGTEIMLGEIPKGVTFFIEPVKNNDLMEFAYILEGTLVNEENELESILNGGDYFYVYKLQETTYFKTLSNIRMLYITTRPVFNSLSNEIKELNEMVKRVEEKDMYTNNHGERLGEYVLKIGEKLNLPKDKFESLYYAALFHDIGKINIPDDILKKPGKLTSEEFEIIKKHPMFGKQIINGTFLKSLGDTILQHHERVDGKGYPFGLKASDISTEAKIICVADSYDAMTSDRPYRKGMSPRTAMDELRRCAGTQYDEEIVNILEKILIEDGVLK